MPCIPHIQARVATHSFCMILGDLRWSHGSLVSAILVRRSTGGYLSTTPQVHRNRVEPLPFGAPSAVKQVGASECGRGFIPPHRPGPCGVLGISGGAAFLECAISDLPFPPHFQPSRSPV